METRASDEVRASYEKLETEELLRIWQENDRMQYRDEAFAVVHEVLSGRGVYPPDQAPNRSTERPQLQGAKVVVTDVQMSFGSMVVFMVKWALAAIPAMIILWFIGVFLFAFLGGLFR